MNLEPHGKQEVSSRIYQKEAADMASAAFPVIAFLFHLFLSRRKLFHFSHHTTG
jgi:hypothetical protein